MHLQLTPVNYAPCVMLRDLDLWHLDLELLQHFGCRAFKRCTKFQQNRLIRGWVIDDLVNSEFEFAPNGVGEGNFGFDRKWILTTPQSCSASSCQILRQSANIRLSYWRLSTFSPCNFRVGADGSQGCVDQTWREHRAIITALQICLRVRIPCCIFKRGRLRVEWC